MGVFPGPAPQMRAPSPHPHPCPKAQLHRREPPPAPPSLPRGREQPAPPEFSAQGPCAPRAALVPVLTQVQEQRAPPLCSCTACRLLGPRRLTSRGLRGEWLGRPEPRSPRPQPRGHQLRWSVPQLPLEPVFRAPTTRPGLGRIFHRSAGDRGLHSGPTASTQLCSPT